MKRTAALRIVLILVLKFVLSTAVFVQNLGLTLVNKDQLYSVRNIAAPYPRLNNIILPEFSGRLFNESGSLQDWIGNAGRGTNSIGLQDIWKSLDRKAYVSTLDWDIQTLAFGKRFTHFQLMVSHHIQGDFGFLYNKDLIGLLAYGNYGYLQQEPMAKSQALDIAPATDLSVYQSIGVDGAYFLNDQNSIGAGIHYLGGWYDFKTEVKKFYVDIRDPLTIKADEEWSLRTANVIDHLSIDSLKVNVDAGGWGLHPGVSYNFGYSHHTDRWQLGIQVRDLGRIKWKGTQYSRIANTDYSGIHINDILNIDKSIFNHISDTLKSITSVDQNPLTYSTLLSSKFILDGQYQVNNHWTLGGALTYSMHSIYRYWQLMGGVVYNPFDFMHLGAHLSMDTYRHVDLGVTGTIRVSVVNLYLNLNPLPALWNIKAYNRVSGSVGMSVQWGKRTNE